MNLLFKILDFYIKSSIHIAFATLAFVQITGLQLNIEVNNSLNYFIFFGTIVGYNFLKYFDFLFSKKNQLKKFYDIIIVSIIALLSMMCLFFKLKLTSQVAFISIGIIIFLYPFLRKFGILKIILVGFSFAFITVFIPCLESKFYTSNEFIILIQRFLIILALMIPFEIYDSKTDNQTLKTLPQLFGYQTTKCIGYGILFLFLSLNYYIFNLHHFITDSIITIIIAVFIYFSNLNRSQYYTSFWVESVPVFWWGICCFF